MAGVVDVGDAIELTFNIQTGATVTAAWYAPDGDPVFEGSTVPEYPASSGKYPKTFIPTTAGIWKAVFTASGPVTQVEAFYVRANSITGPPPLATVGDVEELYGPLTAAQEGLVAALLRRASTMVRSSYRDLADRIASGDLDPDTVSHAVVNMVLRVLHNPNGLRAQTVGPFTRTYDTSVATGLLQLTDAEAAMLADTAIAPASTIRIRAGLAPPPIGIHGGIHRVRRGW